MNLEDGADRGAWVRWVCIVCALSIRRVGDATREQIIACLALTARTRKLGPLMHDRRIAQFRGTIAMRSFDDTGRKRASLSLFRTRHRAVTPIGPFLIELLHRLVTPHVKSTLYKKTTRSTLAFHVRVHPPRAARSDPTPRCCYRCSHFCVRYLRPLANRLLHLTDRSSNSRSTPL